MRNFEHINASNFEEASSKLTARENAMPIAGGTDLIGALKNEIYEKYPETIVNLKEIPGSDEIKKDGDMISIGAMAKLCDIEKNDLIKESANALFESAKQIASPLVRNMATIGGNICQDVRCWYYRYPDSIGGKIMCARKGGEECYAIQGRNQYHSIMGGMKAGINKCSHECPASTDISAYMYEIRKGNWDKAAEIMMRVNPIPMFTSRICPHPCEDKCNQCAQGGDAVAIHSVERTLGDYIMDNADKFYKAPDKETGKKTAIVGAGPAGLTAAYYLRKEGHSVTLYDKMPEAGGILMYGIPEYRLPKHYVRDFVKYLEQMGVVFKGNVEVGKDITIEEIRNSNDSILIGSGAWKQPILGIEGEQLTKFGLNFLVEVKAFMNRQIGKEVLVCGGGNVAMDVALTATRLGAEKVQLVCLEQRHEMPATNEEIERAVEEGVVISNGWGLKKILADQKGNVSGLEAKKCIRIFDDNGRFNPVYDENDVKTFDANSIILATGQKVDLDFLGDNFKDQLKSARGLIEIGEERETHMEGVFAAGDAASGPSIAIKGIRDGGIAARSMSKYLGHLISAPRLQSEKLHFDVNGVMNPKALKEQDTPVGQRSLEKEDSTSLTMEEALQEARRCMNCGCYSVNASDISPVLLAFDAEIVTTKETLPASVFFGHMHSIELLEPGELVTEIRFPDMKDYRTGYLKFRLRESIDFAITSLAYAYKEKDGVIEDARLVAGGIAPVPIRLTESEDFLKGKTISQEVAEKAAELAVADAKPLRENNYKVQEIKTQIVSSITSK